jgi:hypothetical protein
MPRARGRPRPGDEATRKAFQRPPGLNRQPKACEASSDSPTVAEGYHRRNLARKRGRRLRLLGWKPIHRGETVGVARIEFGIGLRMEVRITTAGRAELKRPLRWRDEYTADAFSAVVMALLRKRYPDAFAAETAA